jgi:hypothetical protein
MPKEKAPVVGHPSEPCRWCTKPAVTAVGWCDPCFQLQQRVSNYATMQLQANTPAAPHIRALLEAALATKAEPPPEAA